MTEDGGALAPEEAREGTVRAVERALALLESLSAWPDGATLSELARSTGLSVSTTHRLLVTLEGRGFVRFERERNLWQVGRKAFVVGVNYAGSRNLVAAARPIMRQVGLETGETVNLGTVENGQVTFLHRFDPQGRRSYAPGGAGIPAHCSSLGKAIFCGCPEPEVARLLPGAHLPKLTPQSIGLRSELFAQLDRARQTGFAVDDEENTPGLRCIAAPIFDEYGRPLAALSVAVPAARLPKRHIAQRGGMVAAAARRITDAFGGAEPKRI